MSRTTQFSQPLYIVIRRYSNSATWDVDQSCRQLYMGYCVGIEAFNISLR